MTMARIERVLDCQAQLGEGPVWSVAEQMLYWVDITRPTLNRFDPATGRNTSWTMPSPVGCFALCEQGGALVALCQGFHHFDFHTLALRFVATVEPLPPGHRFNDGTTDPVGRFWAGTMPIAGAASQPEPQGALFCLERDGHTRRAEGRFWTQNGLAFSPDGRTMYVSDTHAPVRTIWALDYDPDSGTASNRRVFFDTREVAGRPDGAAIDADGCYWMAGVGGGQLVRITPQGRLDRIINLPVEKPTKLAFGGRNLDVMYVTSIGHPDRREAGNLFAVHAGVQGLPTPLYTGVIAPP